MDFAAAMSAQMSKAKSQDKAGSKYQRRSELEATREAAYHADQTARETERLRKLEQKRKHEEEELEKSRERQVKRQRIAEEAQERQRQEAEQAEIERRKRIGLPERLTKNQSALSGTDDDEIAEEELVSDLSNEDVIAKLRDAGEPTRLFAETDRQRLLRFSRFSRERSATPGGTLVPRSKEPIPTSLEPVAEKDMKVPNALPPATNSEARLLLARQITSWFNLVLKAWTIALAQRPEDVQKSFSGQAATSSHTQALQHLKPLFRRLEKCIKDPTELPDDLFKPIADIVRAAQERRYVEANDQYLQLSIGKAAWPIGVTMVGIHERSAREKLHESDKSKSHIMGDEQTRKILQSIKRCLSFAQTKWPPEDLGQLMG